MSSLSGRTAIVTGAGRGIGRGIAHRLAVEGAHVYAVDLSEEALKETVSGAHGRIDLVSMDVTRRADLEGLVDRVVADHGELSLAVSNAGINQDALLHKMTDDQWDRVIEVNLTAVFTLTRAAARAMRLREKGRIVNISSASWLGNFGQGNYAAAKAGVVGLTLTASRELAKFQVTANAICPGFIDTDMTRGIPEHVHAAQLAKIPLGRAGSAADVAALVAFLASDDASYITGEVINVGGGYRL